MFMCLVYYRCNKSYTKNPVERRQPDVRVWIMSSAMPKPTKIVHCL